MIQHGMVILGLPPTGRGMKEELFKKLFGLTSEQVEILRSPKGEEIRERYRKAFEVMPEVKREKARKVPKVARKRKEKTPADLERAAEAIYRRNKRRAEKRVVNTPHACDCILCGDRARFENTCDLCGETFYRCEGCQSLWGWWRARRGLDWEEVCPECSTNRIAVGNEVETPWRTGDEASPGQDNAIRKMEDS